MQNKGVKKFSRKLCLLLICQSMAKILWLPSTCELDVDPEKKKKIRKGTWEEVFSFLHVSNSLLGSKQSAVQKGS